MNVFSLGLDELAPKLKRRGIRTDVYNHTFWRGLVDQIANEYRSGRATKIILIGHSLGAVAVIDMVAALAEKGVPVTLAATLDAANTTLAAGRVSTFVNLYIKNGIVGGIVRAGPNFHGRIVNVDLSRHSEVTHFSIADEPIVHDLLLKYVASATSGGAAAPTATSKPAKPATPARVRSSHTRLEGAR